MPTTTTATTLWVLTSQDTDEFVLLGIYSTEELAQHNRQLLVDRGWPGYELDVEDYPLDTEDFFGYHSSRTSQEGVK